jgi:hydrogenase expression/formation protein HypC
MCIAAPGKIIEIKGQKAVVQYPNERREVYTGGEKVKVGDMVLVQMGIVIQKLSEEEAKSALAAWQA